VAEHGNDRLIVASLLRAVIEGVEQVDVER
jgi:hypothetical protein